jgi:hypothetical protein
MEPDPTTLREPLTEAHDADDELYARLERRHGFQEKATYICLVLFIMVLLAAALPAMLYWLAAYKNATPDKFLLPVSIIFAGVAIPVSVHGIRQHLTNFWQPVLQVYVVRILWMVPVFALCSLGELACSLAAIHGHTSYAKYASIPAALRDCYEAYTVLNFFYFMATWIEVFHDALPHKVLQQALAEDIIPSTHTPIVTPAINYPLVSHPILSPYVWAPWRLDTQDFFDQCRYVILLYATVAPLNGLVDVLGSFSSPATGLAATLLSPKNWLDFVQFNVKRGASIGARGRRPRRTRFALTPSLRPRTAPPQPRLQVANHAIYCLVLFYYATCKRSDILLPCKPFWKFIAVKGLVFGTFFQDIAISAYFLLRPTQEPAVQSAVKATLMCVEMLIFALLHAWAFPAAEFGRVNEGWLGEWGNFYEVQRRERRLWRHRRIGRAPPGVGVGRVLFDVSDVHRETSAVARNLARRGLSPVVRAVAQRGAAAPAEEGPAAGTFV